MSKPIRDDQLPSMRISPALRAALEEEALERGNTITGLVRALLRDHAAARLVAMGRDAA